MNRFFILATKSLFWKVFWMFKYDRDNAIVTNVLDNAKCVGAILDGANIKVGDAIVLRAHFSWCDEKYVIQRRSDISIPMWYREVRWEEFIGEIKYILLMKGYDGFAYLHDAKFVQQWFC